MSDLVVSIEEEITRAVSWADLQPDLLAEIFRRLDVVDYIMCQLVCASWRSTAEKTMNCCKPERGRQLPWLLVSTRLSEPRPECFYGLSCFHTKMAKYTLRPPQIPRGRCLGSSQGFLIVVDNGSAEICALNPLTGARFPLPPTAALPDMLIYDDGRPDDPPGIIIRRDYADVSLFYGKPVISPSKDTVAVSIDGLVESANERGTHRSFCNLAFARAGDHSWTTLIPPCTWGARAASNGDFIFHKGGLYVLNPHGNLLVFNLKNLAAPPLISHCIIPEGRIRHLTLTETPDGEDLLLLRWFSSICDGKLKFIDMVVFRLSKNMLEWNQLQCIGDVALFFDGMYLSSFSTQEFPRLQSNCVYFVAGCGGWLRDSRTMVYNLEDKSIHPWSTGDDLEEFCWQRIWFTPAL